LNVTVNTLFSLESVNGTAGAIVKTILSGLKKLLNSTLIVVDGEMPVSPVEGIVFVTISELLPVITGVINVPSFERIKVGVTLDGVF
jgi:hypothetical protein